MVAFLAPESKGTKNVIGQMDKAGKIHKIILLKVNYCAVCGFKSMPHVNEYKEPWICESEHCMKEFLGEEI